MRIDWDNIGLGIKSDRQISIELGVHRRTVCRERNKRKIKPFVGLYILQEGVPCRSIYEAMYDVYLHENGIIHEHEVKFGNCIADFKIGNEYHEIAGMTGFDRYRKRQDAKKQFYEDNSISVKWLSCKDIEELYASCSTKITCRDRFCEECKKETVDIVKNLCRTCYMKRWHDRGQQQTCEQCKKCFIAPDKDDRKFCSHDCYSLSIQKIDRSVLNEIGNGKSIAQIARENNIKPSSLYMIVRRKR